MSPLEEFFLALRVIGERFTRFLDEHGEAILEMAGPFFAVEALDQAGWLPHPAVSLPGIESVANGDVAALADIRYREATATIEDDLLSLLSAAQVPALARNPLEDAISAHRAQHYRACTRLVFPALESLVRVALLGNRWGNQTHLRHLRGLLSSKLSLENLPAPKVHSFKLYSKLEAHFFDPVSSPEAYDRFLASGVPNRHACVHGIIDYSSFQHSINSLILASYVIRMVAFVKANPA
ncbi:hypothetical protein QO058_23670 [Bosea vestrisii]|uniref:hypothetical protein n=1 Tax=Bosea vestrisii TaxID=151416 RepID=UPI0024DF6342|nr:hypothetical protein [Bosea vestrisii]WID95722.1 hypothetical protein QO058_23670 [Bosea vestrisii]